MGGFGWVAATLIAAAAQTARNATQAHLTRALGTVGATQVRFLFGLPFALLFLALVRLGAGEPLPGLTPGAFGFLVLGALSQIGATALMLKAMQAQGFSVATAWIKTEPVLVALGAAAMLGDPLTPAALLAIMIATAGVMLTVVTPGTGRRLLSEAGPAALGLAAAGLFGLAAIGFRGGITALASGGFLIRATTMLVLSLALQTLILLLWMTAFDRAALRGSFGVWRSSLGAGFLGAAASQFWFIGFALTSAANVRTLALIEVVFAQVVGLRLFRQRSDDRQLAGMALIAAGVALLLRAQI